jgi:dTDP-L-rhamnose 4-epimerase
VHILITGGAGFIGSYLAEQLLVQGHRVRILDAMLPQVHGTGARPPYLHQDAELIVGDVRSRDVVSRALHRIDAVYHFAAAVGVGQSMYEIAHYTSTNTVGTAVLLEAIIEQHVSRLVVASSMSIYGEGLYRTARGEIVPGSERPLAQLRRGEWEVRDHNGEVLQPVPTSESKAPVLSTVYALSKFDQERLSLLAGRAYSIPTVALRFFNVYGPRQSLSNPYTGVLAIFAAQLLNRHDPLIFEDGLQRRDFVSVHDVARACVLALDAPDAAGQVFNIGSGESYTVREVASLLSDAIGCDCVPEVCGRYRVGDVRHCFSDISLARERLGYSPRVSLPEGLGELAEWLRGQVADDRVGQARQELAARGLTV